MQQVLAFVCNTQFRTLLASRIGYVGGVLWQRVLEQKTHVTGCMANFFVYVHSSKDAMYLAT
jgi:hypothetical protein